MAPKQRQMKKSMASFKLLKVLLKHNIDSLRFFDFAGLRNLSFKETYICDSDY